MIDVIQQLDNQLLLWINGAHAAFFSTFMWYVSDRFIWLFLYAALLYVIIKNVGFNVKLLFVILIFAAATGLSDYICSSVIRPMVCRPRPSNIDSGISMLINTVNNYRGGHYGFPSSHAANSFALATISALYFRKRALTLFMFVWALALCYSRMYLGVHYPTDILCGAILGTAIAFAVYYAVNHYVTLKEKRVFWHINVIIYAGILVFFAIIIIALLGK